MYPGIIPNRRSQRRPDSRSRWGTNESGITAVEGSERKHKARRQSEPDCTSSSIGGRRSAFELAVLLLLDDQVGTIGLVIEHAGVGTHQHVDGVTEPASHLGWHHAGTEHERGR